MSLMNPRVTQVSTEILASCQRQCVALADWTTPQLVELEHEMEHLRRHEDFSIRTAGEIIRAAAVLTREKKMAAG